MAAMSMRAYAKSRGLNPSTVSRQVAKGIIPTIADGQDKGLIDPVAADAARAIGLDTRGGKHDRLVGGGAAQILPPADVRKPEAGIDPLKDPTRGEVREASLSLMSSRQRLSEAQAIAVELKNARMRSQLVDVDDVTKAVTDAIALMLSRLRPVGGKFAQRAGLKPAQRQLLDRMIEEALVSIADVGVIVRAAAPVADDDA